MNRLAIAYLVLFSSFATAGELQTAVKREEARVENLTKRVAAENKSLNAIGDDTSAGAQAASAEIATQNAAIQQLQTNVQNQESALKDLTGAEQWAQDCANHAVNQAAKDACWATVTNAQNQNAATLQNLNQVAAAQQTYATAYKDNPAAAKALRQADAAANKTEKQGAKEVAQLATVDKDAAGAAQQAYMDKAAQQRDAAFNQFKQAVGLSN